MLGIICARAPKPWILSSLNSSSLKHHHLGLTAAVHGRNIFHRIIGSDSRQRRLHLSATNSKHVDRTAVTGVVSVWHAIAPSTGIAQSIDWRDYLLPAFLHQQQYQKRSRGGGEGSWNVAWDARPARWIHRLDLTCLLFGVCAFLSPAVDWIALLNNDGSLVVDENDTVKHKENLQICKSDVDVAKDISVSDEEDESSTKYRVTGLGVPADGRCLFRAIAHGACLQSGAEAPSEDGQRELADELRAKVVSELLKRREETEWFIEGDFDSYVKRIQQPFVWGGEPELLMASHVLKTPISVYMRDKSSGDLTKIANYGEEYLMEKEVPINVLFHGYGHYDSLETSSNELQKVNMV